MSKNTETACLFDDRVFKMAFKSDTICAICCERFRKDHQNNLKHSLHFQNLCSFLNVVTVGEGATTDSAKIVGGSGQGKKLNNLSATSSAEMTNKLITTAICHPCLVCVSSTLTKRDQLNTLEVEVRQLQRKILQLLSNLQGKVKEYKTEVNKMEAIVEKSRDNVRNLDNFYCSGTMEEDDERGRDLLKDVIQFREKILTVFEDLRNFSNNLQVFSNPAASSTNSHFSTELINNDTSRGGSMGNGKPSRARKRVRVVSEEEEEANDVDLDDDNYPHDHDFMAEDGNADEESPIDGLGNDNFEHASPLNPSSGTSTRVKCDDENQEKSFLPSRNILKSNGGKTQRNPSPEENKESGTLLETIDFSNMTTFKKNLLSRIIKKREKLQKAQTNSKNLQKNKTPEELMFDEIDPRNFCFIDYDPSKSNTLTLRDIDITIDEQEESLECTQCHFKCQNKYKGPCEFERVMYNHVVGQHLRLFLCPHCRRDRFPSIKRFRTHILSHNNRYACDICGKPLSHTSTLKQHKWLHLNEQEKEEAMKNGEKPPEEDYRRIKEAREKRHQCSTCGKRYFYPSDLRKHEENTHGSSRPHMCSQCGKTFKGRGGLLTHLKYVCYPDRGKASPKTVTVRFHCDQCPLTFPIPSKLNVHKRLAHSSECLYSCSMCEKMFKTKVLVTNHERTHSDDRPFLCGKGCGAAYKDKSNRCRHEKKCGKR